MPHPMVASVAMGATKWVGHESGGCGRKTKVLERCFWCGGERPNGHRAKCRSGRYWSKVSPMKCKRCARIEKQRAVAGKVWPDDFGKIPAMAEIRPLGEGPSV